MEFKDVVAKRRSVRKFSDRKVERDVLDSLLEVALSAPSSRNSHSTSFMVITQSEILEKVAQMRDYGSAFVKNAPAAIIVMGDREKSDLIDVNSSISTTMLQLAITDAGLSSCWVHIADRPQRQAEPDGAMAEELLREILPIPDRCRPLCLVALGYSDFQPAPLPDFDKSEFVTYIE